MKRFHFIFLLLISLTASSQQSQFRIREAQNALVERLSAFGKVIPQEKVYIHMDNTCYFQGDTIWFAAYLRQTTDGKPSRVSRVLYVELLNNDGYLVERKLIEMKDGRGEGFFALNNAIQYSGYYELRAYTRWQLNWGKNEREHLPYYNTTNIERELISRQYLDYDKLYSRVFPVYDRPKQAGEYTHDMTLRALRRYYSKDLDKHEMELKFYPEGGNLIAGIENRVAFEATMDDGEWLEGELSPGDIQTQSRGRGVFTITPAEGQTYEMTFTTTDGKSVKANLPKAEPQGVAIDVNVGTGNDSIFIQTRLAGVSADTLAMTIMHEGKLEAYVSLRPRVSIAPSDLAGGVNQVTVFDTQGRVYADRLFFVTKPEQMQPTLTVTGLKDSYKPYEAIDLNIKSQETDVPISLAVRDATRQDYIYDNASIQAEMLLASEIRGFVPNPGWYFESDDNEHRQALDLLMMTQGWRRFNWRDMAVKGEWDLTEPDEQSIVVTGEVSRYIVQYWNNNHNRTTDIRRTEANLGNILGGLEAQEVGNETVGVSSTVTEARQVSESMTLDNLVAEDFEGITDSRIKKTPKALRIHAELVNENGEQIAEEMDLSGSSFKLKLPRFYGKSLFFLSAADTAKWKDGTPYTWVTPKYNPENAPAGFRNRLRFFTEDPDYIVRVNFPYPRFVKPYTYHQNHLSPAPFSETGQTASASKVGDTHEMKEVAVRARTGGIRQFDDSQPAFIIDAYEGFNAAIDAYMTNGEYEAYTDEERDAQTIRMDNLFKIEKLVLNACIGPIGTRGGATNEYRPVRYGPNVSRRAISDELRDVPLDSVYAPKYLSSKTWMGDKAFEMSPGEMFYYDRLSKLDKFVIYTDYSPRLYGDKRYEGSNGPQDIIVVYPYPDDSRRTEYRDRRFLLEGFAYPEEFYSPNYSKQVPQEATDYRRTLYWNPNVKLDDKGQAHITLYNNSRQTQVNVTTAGQTADGKLLWSEP